MSEAFNKPVFRPTWATIDLGALAHNFGVIRRKLSPKIGIMAMVKADAYGHGAVPVAKMLEAEGTRAFGVATVEEGVELRDAGIKIPILVMGGLLEVGAMASKKMIKADLTPVIHSTQVLKSLEEDAKKIGKKVGVHIKIDTGMSRLGVRPEVLPGLLDRIKACRHLYARGVMTHLAEADHLSVSKRQLKLFLECRKSVEKVLGPIPIWHIANSGAIFRGEPVDLPKVKECWARPGLSLYGDDNRGTHDFSGDTYLRKCTRPPKSHVSPDCLKPVMSLQSRIALLKYVPAGTKVSYGGTFKTRRRSRLAVVPIGYADGYPWSVSGKAEVLVCGRRVPVVGRVTMDMIIVDVTDIEEVGVGDSVVLLGHQGAEKILINELAGWAGTISYEILCGISKRMPRIYRSNSLTHDS